MNLDHPRIAIIGSGAVGGFYGAMLARAGHDVRFLVRGDYDIVRRQGWTIRSCNGDFAVAPAQMHVYDDVGQMPQADLVIIAIKTTSNDSYEQLIRPLLKDDTAILTLQNGLGNEERLAELFGSRRIIGGLAFVCSNRTGPGTIHHIAFGQLAVGELMGPLSERVQFIAHAFGKAGVPCEALSDLRFGRWRKLVWNIPFNGLGAAMDLNTGQILASDAGQRLVSQVMEEVIQSAAALGIAFEPDLVAQQIAKTRRMGPYRTSMQIDRQQGRPMEVEAIIGTPLRVARRQHVATPMLAALYEMLQVVDAAVARPAEVR